MSEPQISWCEHKTRTPEFRFKRSHHQIKKRRSSRFDERWKRSGAMTGHHGCDEHYRNRTCPGCQGDEDTRNGGGSSHGRDCYFGDATELPAYVLRRINGKKITYVDKDLGTVYYERTIYEDIEKAYWGWASNYDWDDDSW
jgi:hypothetical protein